MARRIKSFFEENWFWRGTQSAIFYYASCAPILDYKHKRRRRNEAARVEKQRAEVIDTQPGVIRQPGAFQTNEGWVEEIVTGPGPPKGWKKDPIVQKFSLREKEEIKLRGAQLDGPSLNDTTRPPLNVSTHDEQNESSVPVTDPLKPSISISLPNSEQYRRSEDMTATTPAATDRDSHETAASAERDDPLPDPPVRPRLSMERRLSSAVDNLRGTLRSTMHLEGWNWKRYDREDEILSGLNQRMSRMWDRATSFNMAGQGEAGAKSSTVRSRKRADTLESEQYDYQKYARNPEINELHPPVVSRLPTSRDAAAWMLLPAPSAAVMEGKCRPQDEPALRWPLARIGRTASEWETLKRMRDIAEHNSGDNDVARESTPDLSDSVSEGNSEEGDLSWRPTLTKRHSAPVVGWVPIKTITPEYVHFAQSREL